VTATPRRTLWLAAGGLLALVFTVWAGFGLAGWTVGSVERNEHRVLRGEVSKVRIDATSGDVTLVPTDGREVVPRRVSAASSSGDVTVSVPRGGGEAYDAQLATSSGGRHLGLRHDPLADRSLSAVTSSGDAAIRYR
jgi:hypothetical protein